MYYLPLQKFNHCVYEARDGKDLLDGLFEFMGDSVVVPTGQEWEDDVMKPFLDALISKHKEIKKKSDEVTIRRNSESHIDIL